MTLAIVAVVVFGTLVLGGGVVWSVRDVARYRIDTETRREESRHVTAAEERVVKLEARLLKLEQQAGWSKR